MQPAKRHNPYHPTRPASGDVFVGREPICRRVINELREQGRGVSIVGAAGMGKTSLLLAVQRSLIASEDGIATLVAYCDLRPEHSTLELVLGHIAASFIAALQEQHKLHCPHQTVQKVRRLAEQRAQLAEILIPLIRWAWSQTRQPYRVILLLDDIHRLSNPQMLTTFASVLQTAVNGAAVKGGVVNGGTLKLSCVLAGRDELVDVARADVSPLRTLITYNDRLRPLSEIDTGVLVARASAYGWEVEEGCAATAYQLTGGHPYRLHYYLSDALATDGRLASAGMQQRQPVIDPYLNAVLMAEPGSEIDTSAYSRQFNEQVVQLVLAARLEEALDTLLKASRYRDEAHELMLRLSLCAEHERRGLADQRETRAEWMRIGSAILELVRLRR